MAKSWSNDNEQYDSLGSLEGTCLLDNSDISQWRGALQKTPLQALPELGNEVSPPSTKTQKHFSPVRAEDFVHEFSSP